MRVSRWDGRERLTHGVEFPLNVQQAGPRTHSLDFSNGSAAGFFFAFVRDRRTQPFDDGKFAWRSSCIVIDIAPFYHLFNAILRLLIPPALPTPRFFFFFPSPAVSPFPFPNSSASPLASDSSSVVTGESLGVDDFDRRLSRDPATRGGANVGGVSFDSSS